MNASTVDTVDTVAQTVVMSAASALGEVSHAGSAAELYFDAIDDKWWGVGIEAVVFIYCFFGLAIVCDDYLVPSLEILCIRWNVREDVAGASFMAFGSAAPEIIVNAISTLKAANASPESINLGLGAILGSSVIAFSVIPGCCALFSGPLVEVLELKRRPLLRDVLVYTAALVLLVGAFYDHKITLAESSSLLGLYAAYGLVVFFSPSVRSCYHTRMHGELKQQDSFVLRNEEARVEQQRRRRSKRKAARNGSSTSLNTAGTSATSLTSATGGTDSSGLAKGLSAFDEEDDELGDDDNDDEAIGLDLEARVESETEDTLGPNNHLNYSGARNEHAALLSGPGAASNSLAESTILQGSGASANGGSANVVSYQAVPRNGTERVTFIDDSAREPFLHGSPRLSISSVESALEELGPVGHAVTRVVAAISMPLRVLLHVACPSCERGSATEWRYPLTFLVSFTWVAFFSFVISTVVERWGELTQVPLAFFGFFLISIGAEVPDTIQSVTVARRGYGSMAVSNALGSQICNICIGLGLPYTLTLLSGYKIVVADADRLLLAAYLQLCNVALLSGLLFVPVIIYRQAKARLTKKKGACALAMYFFILATYALYAF
ncbi:Sodium/potassium/calcium exchanger 3 [Hondaea fermentalgiana]|uniref:Sodium/potassium/calcium exchanger 3 n=1 Tax=Hondaea fermentalgiana TaxID=2315210 RepID=A0A2R5G315_9STRA|nr:Sodium/potassium/calcium exchanger 3 [Hondaea fermentalgiana]|eukprot:GBG25402.1 Sodium/potassium/calcium exchanger 3 [Hondaea fermentalgiana]